MKTVNIREVPLSEIVDLPVHEVADIFPLLANNSLEREAGKADKQTITLSELADSIVANGLQEPIVLFNRTDVNGNTVTWLLDGRNRRAACIKAKVETVLVEDFIGTEEEAEEYILNLNIDRRDLTPGQRADAAAAYWDLEAEKAKARMTSGINQWSPQPNLAEGTGQTRDALAKRFRVSHSYIDKLHKEHEVVEKNLEQAEKLQEQATALEAAEAEAKIKLEQAKARADAEAIAQAAKEANEASLKKIELREQAAEVSNKAAESQRKINRIQRGESVNSVFGEQKQKTQQEDPVGALRTRINSSFANLTSAVEELGKIGGQSEDDWNFVSRKIDSFIRSFEESFGMEV